MIGVDVRVGRQRASEDYFETQTSSSAVRSTRNGGAAWIMTQYLTGLDPEPPHGQLRRRHSKWRKRPVPGLRVS
ncbi:MAG: hypothetical protein JWO04_981 [Gammaproteobacteria bacterium]|nr:hypothetical protein [Gammaproteobacteria bacterium]